MNIFENRLNQILDTILESEDNVYDCAVAIVKYRNKWLLGLSTSNGDRHNKWCFPGGGIKRGESPKKAAERECYEEMGVKCKAVREPFALPSKPNVAFVLCRVDRKPSIKVNPEFICAGFYTLQEMKNIKLYHNVKKLIDRVT